jgi:uncharacterized protein
MPIRRSLRSRPSTDVGRRSAICAIAIFLACFATVPSPAFADPPTQSIPAAAKVDRTSNRPANRLAKETSPYLLLHAHNPVDWYPWGEEALAKARAEKKLIFLSIGYSSCYWCHVMERESFLDDEVAAALNKDFVCIKVDREERPEIDHIYMTALGVMGRQGGWPLTMILTPDAQPIFGGTYFPARDKDVDLPATQTAPQGTKQRVTGLLSLLKLVSESWAKNPQELSDYAGQVATAVKRSLRQRVAVTTVPAADVPAKTVAAIAEQFDGKYGGFSYSESNPRRPKFPEPSNLLFLFDRAERANDESARRMLNLTLEHMATGGIRDHLGGGFHRYSTDRYWRIPHFEKMLYDNAQLASVYAAAARQSGRADFHRVTEELLAFVSRELTSPEGAFFSALDAETDADEGQFYVWTRDELTTALSDEDFRLFGLAYSTAGEPNFDGRYVIEQVRPIEVVAAASGLAVEVVEKQLAALREKLLAKRSARPRPLTDTKVLTGWNGQMIRGFADAGRLLNEPEHVQTAARAADFVLKNLRTPEGRLQRSYAQGQAHLNAYLDDYAFLVDGLLALHEATGEDRWLGAADDLTKMQIKLFWDAEQGGFFFTSDDHEQLLARSKDPVDSAQPSGNAVATSNLVYLGRTLERPEYWDRAEKTINAFAAMLNDSPAAMPRMVLASLALGDARSAASGADKPAASEQNGALK